MKRGQLVLIFYFFLSTLVCSLTAHSQTMDPNSLKFIKKSDLAYSKDDSLKADIYIPADNKATQFPVLIFINASGSRSFRNDPHYYNWTKEAASGGFVSVIFDVEPGKLKNNFIDLLSFLAKNETQYKGDINQLAIYAGSGNVIDGLPLANELHEIKAALIFYGVAPLEKFRIDLPVYLVRAGLDNIGLNKRIDTLVFKALQANAPYMIVNMNIAQHGFESDSTEISEDQIQNALQFLRRTMFLRNSQTKLYDDLYRNAIAFRELYNADYDHALSAFREILSRDTSDNEAERMVADIYILKGEYDSALLYYDKAMLHCNWRKG